MKKILYIILLCLLCMSCSSTPVDHTPDSKPILSVEEEISPDADLQDKAQSESKTLVFAIGEYPPYTSTSLDNGGFCTEIVREAYRTVGVEIELEYYPWSRAWELMVHNKVDGSFPWTPTEYRREFILFSEAISPFVTSMIYMKDNPKVPESFTTLEDLKELNIGGVEYYYYLEWFENINKEIDLSIDELDALKKLKNGRFDILPGEVAVIDYLLDFHFPDEKDQFAYLNPPIRIDEFRMVISKDHPNANEYMKLFNKGLETIKENGTFDEILKKHNVEELFKSDISIE